MFAEPRQSSFDGRWLEFGCHHVCRHSGVVNLNYSRQISLNSITDYHFVQGTVDTASKLDSAPPVFDVHGLRFLIGLRVTAGDLVCLESVGVVPAGLGTGNANVGDGDAEFVADTPAGGDAVALGNGSGLCTGLGDGEGGIIFSQ